MCFVLFTVYVFTVAYVTVLLPVGVIKDDDDDDDDSVPSQCRFRGDIV